MTRLTIALALGFAATGTAHAACDASPDVTVCSAGSPTCTTDDLSQATSTAADGDVICIQGDYTHTGNQVDIIGKAVTIQHDGVGTARIERGSGGTQVDIAADGSLTISDVTIDGSGGGERGIRVLGTLNATNVVVRDHTGGFVGAGILIDGGSGTCTDCLLDNNTNSSSGGHIQITGGGDLDLVDSVVQGGQANFGGGADVNNGLLAVQGSTFENNQANDDGGAIFVDGAGGLTVDRSWFIGNTTNVGGGHDGGAIFVNGPDDIDVFRSVFCGNEAREHGGAIYLQASDDSEIRGSIFLDNDANNDHGGGVYIHDGSNVHVTNSTFASNSANAQGGGLNNRHASGDAASNVYVDHSGEAIHEESGGSALTYGYSLFFGNGTNAGGSATASAGNGDLFVSPGFTYTPDQCNPALVQQPLDSVTVGAGDASLGDDPDGSANTMGAFGGPFAFDLDLDNDTYNALVDCDETDPSVNPGAPEIPSDGIDNDCSGSDFVDSDGDTFEDAVDCGPLDPYAYPGAPEIVGDGIDQDCNGADSCYEDMDEDGYGGIVALGTTLDCDSEAGLASLPGDCDDRMGAQDIYPGAYDVPGDGVDQDCDFVDDCFIDNDNDGYGDGVGTGATLDCDSEIGFASIDGDCDDGSAGRFPGNLEIIADGVDQDCVAGDLCYLDNDNDDFGQTNTIASADFDCADVNEASVAGDCNDGDATVFPGAVEGIADDIDQDCNGQELCYFDSDNDGYGTSTTTISADLDCNDLTESYNDEDCADGDDSINPMGIDIPGNTLDEDCNGRLMCWLDNDNDGSFGTQFSGESPSLTCNAGAGFAFDANADDCDDGDGNRYPGATELVVSGVDENCDGQELCYVDADADGYGIDIGTTTLSASLTCSVAGVSARRDDCDDGIGAIHPDAAEIALDFVDQNCDRRELCAQDSDGDGFGSEIQPPVTGPVGVIDCVGYMVSPNQLDCNDGAAAINPEATEQVALLGDQDCDDRELCYVDEDEDTYGTSEEVLSTDLTCIAGTALDGRPVTNRAGDCLDTDASYYPGAPEIPGDGQDQDCSGADLVECYQDLDGDGVGTPTLVPDPTGQCTSAGFSTRATDCDDTRADVNPDVAAADDTCDGIDNDCQQQALCPGSDDGDGDGLCLDEETLLFSTDDCAVDSDGDGWLDPEEAFDPFGVDPALADTDGDGVDDGAEWPRVTDPSDSPKPDLDTDGVPDVVDADDDGDGVDSVLEGGPEVDRDGDGIPDREDTDDDNDGIPTIDEVNGDTDNDGRPNRIDADDDGDGWETAFETAVGANYLSIDSDSDGRLDPVEGDWEGEVPVLGTLVDCVQLALDVDPGLATIGDMNSLVRDFDGDGLHDLIDGDDDGDGHLTLLEGNDDLDGDGCPNSLDLDSDGDGKPDSTEGISADNDLDSIPDLFDADDNDGGLVDSDGDLVLTIDEVHGTLSLDPDTSCAESHRAQFPSDDAAAVLAACDDGSGDKSIVTSKGDLAIDGLELGPAPDFDLIDRDNDGIFDWMDVDDDGDGVLTEMEVGFGCAAGQEASIVKLTVKGTTAAWLQCLDPEGAEVTYQRLAIGGAPGPDEVAYRDTDGDGIYDFQDPDDDGDGIATADELGGDATPADRDGDGTPDYLDEFDEDGPLGDLDADGIPNEVEEELQLDPFDNDSDGDGVHDGDEIGDDWTEPMDSDGDGTPDVFDTDDDNDGVDTADESRGDTDGDGIPDYLDTDSDDDGVDDGEEYGVDDDCDGDPDHIDAILNEGLCDQVAFDPGYYERQACSCASGTTSGWLGGWLALGLGWMVRRR